MKRLKSRLPEIIQAYLDEKKITQVALAKMVGLNPASLSRLMNSNAQRIDLDTVAKLREVIPFDVRDLVEEIVE